MSHACSPGVAITQWGPAAWNTLHVFAHTSPEQAGPLERQRARTFLREFARRLPCPKCRAHFDDFLDRRMDDDSVATRGAFVQLIHDAHNEVNVRTGKRALSLEEHYEVYRPPRPRRVLRVEATETWAVLMLLALVVVRVSLLCARKKF